jgi:cytochrome c oxidase cbb3-type subunit 3
MNEQRDPILDHEIDGIKELDNKLPRWWVWLFNLTTIFAVIYMAYYHGLKTGSMQEQKYQNEIAAAEAAKAPAAVVATDAAAAPATPAVEEPSKDEAVLAKGKQLFTVNCAVCHGQNGEGLIGPNFCDDSFIHGPAFADSLHIIREGVLAKGMISWKAVLKPDDILAVGSYIYSLRGSNPPNPKAPEGVKAGS